MVKKRKLSKVFFAFLALVLFSTVIFNVNAAETYDSANFTKKGDVIYFEKPDFFGDATPKVYAWNSINKAELSAFPGEEMELVKDNLYKYEFKTDGQFSKLLFHNGNGKKTKDLDFICSEYVYKDDELVSYTKRGDVIYYKGPYTYNAYIYLYNSETNESNAAWPGVKMDNAGTNDTNTLTTRYVVNSDTKFDKVIFNNGSSQQTQPQDYVSSGVVYTENSFFLPTYLKVGDTVYFEKNDNWGDTIYVYMWNSNNSYSQWNSTQMTKVDGNIYSYTLTNADTMSLDGMPYIIFSDGTHQTKDLHVVGKSTLFKINDEAITTGSLRGKYDGFWSYSQNKSSLENLIKNTKIQSENEKYYTANSLKVYKDQLELAKTLTDKNTKYINATFEGYTSQYEKSLIGLKFAYDNLKIDPTILSNKIDEMKKVDTTPYTKDSVDEFNDAIKDAEAILNDLDTITIEKIKTSIDEMQEAYDKLVLDKTELKNLIDEANKTEKDKYTDDSVTNLESVVKDATEVYDDEDATYEEIKTQVSALKEAISKLELKPENNDSKTDEKVNNATTTAAENTSNPFTGDIIYVFIGLIILAIIALVLSFIISKKNKAKNTK